MAVGKSWQHTVSVGSYNKGTGYVTFYFEENYDAAANVSYIHVTRITATHSRFDGYIYSGRWYVNARITADGVPVATLSGNQWSGVLSTAGVQAEITGGTLPIVGGAIPHNDADGKKTVSIEIAIDSLLCNEAGWISNNIDNEDTHTVALTTIPRLSEISAANGTLGVAQTLSVAQKSASYTHSIGWVCGSASGTICTKSSALSFNWTPSIDLASQNTTGASVSVVFTITTYSGDTAIGSKTLNVIYAIPDSVKPSVTMTITDANGYADKYGGYVQKRSKLKVVLGVVTAYGSEIAVNAVSVEGITYYGESIETAIINGSGSLAVTATVTDKRGRVGTATVNVDVLEYASPAILGVTYNRANADGTDNPVGEYAEVTMNASVTALGNNNSATYRLQYKKLSDSTYTDFDMSGYQNVYSLEDVAAVFSAAADYSYNIVFTVSDDFSEKFGVAKTEFILQTGKVLMHRRAKGVGMGLGRICEEDDLLDIDWNIRGRKNLDIDGALTVGDVSAENGTFIGNVEAQNIKVNGDLITAKPVAPRNLLDNSDFSVNQRGQTKYITQSGYTFDRWYAWHSASATHVWKNNGYISVWAENTGAGSFTHRFEKGFFDSNKKYTFAYKTHNGNIVINNNPVQYTDTFDYVGISLIANQTVNIVWTALYEGEYTAETLPPYIPKGYAAELTECKRYFQIIPYTITMRYGYFDETYYFDAMRVTPTAVIYSSNGTVNKASYYNGNWVDMDASLTVWNEPFGGSLRAYATANSNCNFGFAKITLSADL